MKYRAASAEDKTWFCATTNYIPSPEFGGIVAYSDDGLQAMVGLDYWTPKSVHIHIAINNPHALRGLWREVLRYLRQHGRVVVIGVTPGHLSRALRMTLGLGFEEVARIRDGWDEGSDLVITEYRIDEPAHAVAA